jgi:D-tyrosyl-tRNA(Tyr) deacylase
MRIVIQRVSSASVTVGGETVSSIGHGLCLLVGIAPGDTPDDVEAAVAKISGLRIFADSEERMNLSVADVGGEVLVVSQFTLYGDVRKGRRPSFTGAAQPDIAEPLIERMVQLFGEHGLVASEGVFGARMEVGIVNDGPVTIVLEVSQGQIA